MDIKKLNKWADLLLDTGKRNNLINFKDTRTSTVEILLPSSEVLFEKFDGTATFEVYDPKIVEEDEEELVSTEGDGEIVRTDIEEELVVAKDGQLQLFDSEQPETASLEPRDEREAYCTQYAPKIKKQNQLLAYNAAANPMTAIKNIDKKAREFIEETGVNVAYMAFGFIHWKENESSAYVFHAPVLLVPIRLEHESAISPYYIKSTEDDVIVNPTFAYKMDAEYGVKLPDYEDEGLSAYLDKVRRIVAKLHWTVSSECKIGIFSFQKINMYRDLKDNARTILANQNVCQLLGEPIENSTYGDYDSGNEHVKLKDPLIELHSVVDADSSQIEAIEMAKSGKSFVLQGPPGTGKSQTITNIIAECLSDGKKVLFVSEKMAALNVVYEKLKQAGLAEFCLELHSHKANKKEIIADICHTLRESKSAVSAKADIEIALKERAQKQLDSYAIELHAQRPVIERSLYQLYEASASTRNAPFVDWPIPQIKEKGEEYLRDTAALLEQYVDYIPSVGYDYRNNPWYGYVNQDTSYQTKAQVKSDLADTKDLLTELVSISASIFERYNISCNSAKEVSLWRIFFRFAATSKIITPDLLRKDLFDAADAAVQSLWSESTTLLSTITAVETVFDKEILEKIDASEYYKKLTRQFNGTFSRLFNSEYKQLINNLRIYKKDGRKLSYEEAVAFTERIAVYQKRIAEFHAADAPVKHVLASEYKGIYTDWSAVVKEMDILRAVFEKGASFGSLATCADLSSECPVFADFADKLDTCWTQEREDSFKRSVSYFDESILNVELSNMALVLARCNDCLNDLDRMDNWCHFRSLLSSLSEKNVVPFLDVAISQNVEAKHLVNAFKQQFYYQWIDSIISETPVLSSFTRIAQDRAIKIFAEKDTEQFEINKAKIRASISANRPSLDMIASGSALALLLREGEKKRKQKSIRTLISEAGELIQRVKPCFLMSPLSVSTFLTAGAVHFDVVVFDEASQIFPQDAIGAIYRANQLIVVGDSKQMPPSNFFNSTVEVDDNDEETGDVTDFESILDLCSTSMQQLRLRWHYRSRYEQLIVFSNKNFYDNDLVTFPSSKADTSGVGVDYYHVDGLFDRKSHTNRKEAEFVVDLIYKNIEKYPNRSLGVVAFSVAQQDLIDKLLSKRRQDTPEKEFFFKRDAEEPFFVKNLETVQGDERDTIIFSVAYGMDAQGRLLHNFGPLNRVGGERRLNVAVTRAKHNVQLVSSMHHTDIDLKRTSAEGAKLLREYLDFAENGQLALERALSVSQFEQFDSDFELEVCEFLRSKGFSVDTQVGCSGFRIDLGLKLPNSSDYVLAIECDGAAYHSSKNARDRDRLRQEILERMGWKFYRIWSTDWFRNKSVEQAKLLEVATEAVRKPEQVKATPESKQPIPTFEEKSVETRTEFPRYEEANIGNIHRQFPRDFKRMVQAILEVEAPLSEDLLLRRMVWYFDRDKVTSVVQRNYEQQMYGHQRYGIIRRNGFLYLNDNKEIKFRTPGTLSREIKQIAPEELGAGMLEILKQNMSADKTGLYQSMAHLCGVSRVGKTINAQFDLALQAIGEYIVMDGDVISLK